MASGKVKKYKEHAFDHLKGLDGISDAQVEEHLKLYGGYVKNVNTLNQELTEMRGRGKPSGTNPEFAELMRRRSESTRPLFNSPVTSMRQTTGCLPTSQSSARLCRDSFKASASAARLS